MTTSHAPSRNLVNEVISQHDGREERAERVEADASLPALLAGAQPAHDHAGLREREREEHADGEQRDQARDGAVERGEDRGGGGAEHDDAVGEREAVAHPQEQARGGVVAGEEEQQPGEVREGGVGGEQQHERGGGLHVAVQHAVAEAAVGELGEHGLRGLRHDPVELDQDDGADEHHHEQAHHPRQRGARVAPLDALERGDPVGDRLDPGHRGRARPEGTQDQQQPHTLDGVHRRAGRRVEAVPGGVREADGDEQEDREDEHVRRRGEQQPRLAHATEVAGDEHRDHREPERDPVGRERGDRGGDGGDPGGDRHGDGEDVVEHQPGGGDEPGDQTEVVGGDDVRAPAAGVRADRLAVGEPDDDHQHEDRERDDPRVAERRGPAEREHDEHRFGAVRHGGERVGGEHRQRDQLAHALLEHRGGVQRGAEQRAAHPPRGPPPARGGVPRLARGFELLAGRAVDLDRARSASARGAPRRAWRDGAACPALDCPRLGSHGSARIHCARSPSADSPPLPDPAQHLQVALPERGVPGRGAQYDGRLAVGRRGRGGAVPVWCGGLCAGADAGSVCGSVGGGVGLATAPHHHRRAPRKPRPRPLQTPRVRHTNAAAAGGRHQRYPCTQPTTRVAFIPLASWPGSEQKSV